MGKVAACPAMWCVLTLSTCPIAELWVGAAGSALLTAALTRTALCRFSGAARKVCAWLPLTAC